MKRKHLVWMPCMLLLVTCDKQDESALETRVATLEQKVAELEKELQESKENDVVPISPVEEKIDALMTKIDSLATVAPPPVPLVEPDTEGGSPAQTQGVEKGAEKDIAKIGISKTEVDKIMEGARRQVRLCGFQDGAAITFDVRVAQTGRVSEVSAHPPHRDTPLGRCAAKVLYRQIFPATGSPVGFSHMYTF